LIFQVLKIFIIRCSCVAISSHNKK
jgi:hypothetical protein